MLYVSRAAEPLTQFQVMRIVIASRRHNWRAGLTGCLLFTGSAFAQVLEGPGATVQALFERLASDPRHAGVRILSNEAADNRHFSSWTMGYIADADLSLDVAALLEAATVPDALVRRVIDRMARDVFLGTS